MDDVGASSKRYEIYSRVPFGNILFLKYLPLFKAWGPYHELTIEEWRNILDVLARHDAALTVGVTACWVEADGTLIPFNEKWPDQARLMKEGVTNGLLEIANHGLTHCVVGRHLPRLLAGNRTFHREFHSWLPKEIHETHIARSQTILQDYFELPVVTLIPPGNVWTEETEHAAFRHGIRYVSSQEELTTSGTTRNGLTFVSTGRGIAFHDRELVLNGVSWLSQRLHQSAADGFDIVSVSRCASDF